MIKRTRYVFNKDLKKDFLKGRSATYIADTIGISYSYICRVLQSNYPVDDYFIHDIMEVIGYSEKEINNLKNTYFIKKGE